MTHRFVNWRFPDRPRAVASDPKSCEGNTSTIPDPENPTPNFAQTNVGFGTPFEGHHVGDSVGSGGPSPLGPIAGFHFFNPAGGEGWVYFLLDKAGGVLYVGQADDLIARLRRHPHQGKYSRAGFVRAPLRMLNGVEAVFIAAYDPPLNCKRPPFSSLDIAYVAQRFFGGRKRDIPNYGFFKQFAGMGCALRRPKRVRTLNKVRRPASAKGVAK